MPRSSFSPSSFCTAQRATRDRAQPDSLISLVCEQVRKIHPRRLQKGRKKKERPRPFFFKAETKSISLSCPFSFELRMAESKKKENKPKKKKKIPRDLSDLWKRERRLSGKVTSAVVLLPALFRFAAICGLIPLYALLTVRGRRQGSGVATGTHPQPLEAPALGADADVAAASGNQGGLLGQSV